MRNCMTGTRAFAFIGSIVVAVQLEDGSKGLAGQGNAAQLTHLLFAFLLLLQQLLFAGDVAAVALGKHVLAHGLDRFTGNDLAADGDVYKRQVFWLSILPYPP